MLRQRSRARVAVAVIRTAIKRSVTRMDAVPAVAINMANAIRSAIRDGLKRSAKKINPRGDILIKKISRLSKRSI